MSTDRSEWNAKLSRGKNAAADANTAADASRAEFEAAMEAASGDRTDPKVREAAIEMVRTAKRADEESEKYRSYVKDQAQKAVWRIVWPALILLFLAALIFG